MKPFRSIGLLLSWVLVLGSLSAAWADDGALANADPTATRFKQNPLVTVESSSSLGGNVNGPTLVRVPEWVKNPLGKYYLYFANHKGRFIRLAYADSISGPWKIYEPGVLNVADTAFFRPQPDPPTNPLYTHVASPEIYIDQEHRKIILWAHGMWTDGKPWPADPTDIGKWLKDRGYAQYTQAFESEDGIHFQAHSAITQESYLRVFRYKGHYYGIARSGQLLRSKDAFSSFLPGSNPFQGASYEGKVRHVALLQRGKTLYVFFSAIGDAPERILVSTIDLSGDWRNWKASAPTEVLASRENYECPNLPVIPSHAGDAEKPVHELRDPGIYVEKDRVFLLYSICGEQGLAAAELSIPQTTKK